MSIIGITGDIIAGHAKRLVKANETLSESRMNICRQCPIYEKHPYLGEVCDSKKYINADDDVKDKFEMGYTKGCGCVLDAKTRNLNAHCIVWKW